MPDSMKRIMLAAIAALMFLPIPAPAQVGVQIHVNIPVNPPLVVVQPGIQVVEDYDEEVFYTGGFYWVRRDGYWYRTTSPRGGWVYVEPRRVPPGLQRMPPGQYKHYRKDQAKAERKAWKEQEKAEKKGRGHGKGHGGD
jgi:hypothetical protein